MKEPQELFRTQGLLKKGQVYDEKTKKYGAHITEPCERLMTMPDIESSIKYQSCMSFIPQTWESIGSPWPEGTTVEKTGGTSRMCYETATYLVKSPRELTPFDWEVLHANRAFLSGQVCGAIRKTTKTAEGWEYECWSECDSSD